MRIGIFGGSFDPVHCEHIRLAESAVKTLALDKLIVMPVASPPHKKGKELAPDRHRLELCKIAFARVPNAEVSDYEITKGGTSYTYLTCRHFREIYKEAELFWLVGTDMLRDFPTWKNPEDILSNATLAVCARDEKEGWAQKELTGFTRRFGKEFVLIGYNGAPVSSTQVRVLAGAGMRLTPLVTEETEAYIRENKLYAIENAEKALALEKPARVAHSLRVAFVAAKRAVSLGVSERKAILASLFHDCAKNLEDGSPLLKGFVPPAEWGEIPREVTHQFAGAYLAEHAFGVTDGEVLDAIRFHTSGKAGMSALGKLIFLADMIEPNRSYEGVEKLRELFEKKNPALPKEAGLDECLEEALRQTVAFLEGKGEWVYPLTKEAYEYYKNLRNE